MKKKVVFPSRHPHLLCDDAVRLLQKEGFDVVFNTTGIKLSPQEQKKMISDAFAVIAGTEKYDREMLTGCENLKTIIRFGVGTDNFDLTAMEDLGIKVGIIANHNAVAEFALTLILSVLKNMPEYDKATRQGSWARYDMRELSGKTVGIVGFGRIGRRLAELLKGFDVKILAYSPHIKAEIAEKYGANAVSLDYLLKNSDIVSLHLPDKEDTKHLFNADTINKMKDGAILINTSRGSLIDEAALYNALETGKLSGAGLDVYETEPVDKDNPLFKLDSVVLSPHVSALTKETNYNAGIVCAQSIINVFNGGVPVYPL